MTYTDDILQTYLAGSLDTETAAALEDAVANDPTLEARLMALDPIAAPVKEAFEGVPPHDRLAHIEIPNTKSKASPLTPFLRYAAVGLIGAVLGYGLFSENGPPNTTDWKHQVAAYQTLYVPETVKNIPSEPSALAAQFAMAQDQIGIDLQQQILSNIATLDLKRAQILGYEDQPLIQIAFEGAAGTPIALCIIRNRQGQGSLQSETIAGLASASWSTGTHSFLLIGGTEQDAITKTAASLVDIFG